jgi:hypothetical protein
VVLERGLRRALLVLQPVIVGDLIEEVVQKHAINGFRKGLEVLMYVDLPKEPLLADAHCLEVVLNNCKWKQLSSPSKKDAPVLVLDCVVAA